MKCFIDPQLYIYTDDDWVNYSFVDRLQSLINALEDFEKIEKGIGNLYKTFRFLVSDVLQERIYSHNPFVNEPNINSFYPRQFKTRVLPELLRRLDADLDLDGLNTDLCTTGTGTIPDVQEPSDEIKQDFRASVSLFETIYGGSERLLVYSEGHRSLQECKTFFNPEVHLPTSELRERDPTSAENQHLKATDPVRLLWDATQSTLASARLRCAIVCKYLHLKQTDPEWERFRVGPVDATEEFWRTIRDTDFHRRPRLYIERILYAVTQISCARDVTINAHRMEGQRVSYKGVNSVFWNAYVFKMGATDTDKRCSRIYYIRTSSGAVLMKFDPDAHP